MLLTNCVLIKVLKFSVVMVMCHSKSNLLLFLHIMIFSVPYMAGTVNMHESMKFPDESVARSDFASFTSCDSN